MTPTCFDCHTREALENDTGHVIIVKKSNGTIFCGGTAGFGDVLRSHDVDQSLYYSMVGSIHVHAEGKRTLSATVVRIITIWGNQKL